MTKTALSPEEKLRAATAKVIYGTTDAEIALILGVSNVGRVSEGLKEILAPLKLAEPGYKENNENNENQVRRFNKGGEL